MARMQAKEKGAEQGSFFHGSFMRLWYQSHLTGSRLFITPAEDEARTALRHQAVAAIAEKIHCATGLHPLQLGAALWAVSSQGKAVATAGYNCFPRNEDPTFLVTIRTPSVNCHD